MNELYEMLNNPQIVMPRTYDDERVTEEGCRWYISQYVHAGMLTDARSDMLQHTWLNMYQAMTKNLARLMSGKDWYFIIKMSPIISEPDFQNYQIRFTLWADVLVTQGGKAVIPNLVYGHSGQLTGWICGWCVSLNEMKEKHCIKCGTLRALLLYEMTDA